MEAARFLWPLLFSRLFEVTTLSGKSIQCGGVGEDRKQLLVASMALLWVAFWSGPRLPKTQLVLAINWKGMYFLDQKERTLLGLSFAEVMGLVANR